MSDPIYEDFLRATAEDAVRLVEVSDALRLIAVPSPQGTPRGYLGRFTGVPHLVRGADGQVTRSVDPILFQLRFPPDYLYSADLTLAFRVARIQSPLFNPNVRSSGLGAGLICLGTLFQPGTRLRPLLSQVHGIVSSRTTVTDDGFDRDATLYYRRHVEEVRALRSAPLWRQPLARRVVVRAPRSSAGERQEVGP